MGDIASNIRVIDAGLKARILKVFLKVMDEFWDTGLASEITQAEVGSGLFLIGIHLHVIGTCHTRHTVKINEVGVGRIFSAKIREKRAHNFIVGTMISFNEIARERFIRIKFYQDLILGIFLPEKNAI